MATYKGITRKQFTLGGGGDAAWSNVYHIPAISPEAAMVSLQVVAAAEMAIHSDDITITTLEISDPTHLQNGRKYTMNDAGERTAGTNPLPNWNVVTVLMYDLAFTRPQKKYYRLPIYEEDHTGGTLDGALTSLVLSTVQTLVDDGVICGPGGEELTTVEVLPTIQMRQTDWARRGKPGFHRGYVAN